MKPNAALSLNQYGTYCIFGTPQFSKFHGYIGLVSNIPTKFIDEFVLPNTVILDVVHTENRIMRTSRIHNKRKVITEIFEIDSHGNLLYTLTNYSGQLHIDFDIRTIDNFDPWGKNYTLTYEDPTLLTLHFIQGITQHFMHFSGITQDQCTFSQQWVQKTYTYDQQRHSHATLHVFRGLTIDVNRSIKLKCSFGCTQQESFTKCSQPSFAQYAYSHQSSMQLPEHLQQSFTSSLRSYFQLFRISPQGNFSGIYAGYPWFSQTWTRDTLISTRPLLLTHNHLLLQEIIEYFSSLYTSHQGMPLQAHSDITSPDGALLLAHLIQQAVHHFNKHGAINTYFTQETLHKYLGLLQSIKQHIITTAFDHEKGVIKVNEHQQWMDTLPRQYPVELQALYLSLLSGIMILSDLLHDTETFVQIQHEHAHFREHIRQLYFTGTHLHDDLTEHTSIRCNGFLAYYFYSQLLNPIEWKATFTHDLSYLWQSWGGISTLSKKDPHFCIMHTGETDTSYHQGDCWYWIHNVVTYCLIHNDYAHFKPYILKLLRSSYTDQHKLGYHMLCSELSSAKQQTAQGCLAQTWSLSTWIECLYALHSIHLPSFHK